LTPVRGGRVGRRPGVESYLGPPESPAQFEEPIDRVCWSFLVKMGEPGGGRGRTRPRFVAVRWSDAPGSSTSPATRKTAGSAKTPRFCG